MILYFQSMNLTMIKVMQGFVNGTNTDYLMSLLDMAKEVAQSHTIQEDEDAVSNEETQNDAEEIALNEAEIKNLYVSLKTWKRFT